MSIDELNAKIEKQLETDGMTDEAIIKLYGSTENWVKCIVKRVKQLEELQDK